MQKERIVSELELVQEYGTKSIQNSYQENNGFIGNYKARLLKRVENYWDVEQIGSAKYRLSNLKNLPEIKEYHKSHDGIYQYICPLILKNLLKEKNKDRLLLGYIPLARSIEMINKFYKMIQFNPSLIGDIIPISTNTMYDFYGHSDDTIIRYIDNALKYLSKMGIIIYREEYIVRHFDRKKVKFDGRKITVYDDYQPATEQEMRWYARAVERADKTVGILAGQTHYRYFGNKSYDWQTEVNKSMGKHGIMNVIKAYDIYVVDAERCKEYLDTYDNLEDHPKLMTAELQKNLNKNALVRYEKNPEKYNGYVVDASDPDYSDYLDQFELLSRLVIGDVATYDELSDICKQLEEKYGDRKEEFTVEVKRR